MRPWEGKDLFRRCLHELATRRAWLCASLLLAVATHAAVPVRTLSIDLAPLIDAAAAHTSRFAVEVPHHISAAGAGEWSQAAGEARWHYSVRIPGAVSMSLHAGGVALPPHATLVISGSLGAHFAYTSRDVHAGDLWSRVLKGDTLDLTLSMPAAERAAVQFSILGLQAGYRGLGAGTANHPHYDELRRRSALAAAGAGASGTGAAGTSAANPNAGCIENYECEATTANAGNAHATAALIVANLVQCTGVLVGNVRNDGIPYMLTARHCEQDTGGGGAPANAASTMVFWDAITPCGDVLGDLYDPSIVTQTGATTVVEQQDVWLIMLSESPIIPAPYFAGFDVSGGTIQGGYTLHHALSTKKQIVDWFGAAVPYTAVETQLGGGFTSTFWGVSSQLGFFGPGASGGGLFDQNDHLVGTASLERDTNGGPGSCPVAPVTAPTVATAGAFFTSLAAVWNSTSDATSTTGTATLASVLDPQNTGTQVIAGASGLDPLVLTASVPIASITTPVELDWTAATATSCTAGGGVSGDGWSGPQAVQGPLSVTSPSVGSVTYGITCHYPSGRVSRSTVQISWTLPQPSGGYTGTSLPVVWVGAPYVLTWSANTSPCTISSNVPTGPGTDTLTGLPATGSATLVFSQAQANGETTLSCGTSNTQLAHTAFSTIAPAFSFTANSTDRILGQPLELTWDSIADYCTPTGGAPNDGWITAQRAPDSTFQPLVTAVGSYTYGLDCSAGSVSVSSQVTVNVTNDTPYVTLQVMPTTVTAGGQYSVVIASNIDGCYLGGAPGLAAPMAVTAQSTLPLIAEPVGTYALQVSCSSNGLSAISPAIALTVMPVSTPPAPTVSLSLSASTVTITGSVVVSWSSSNASTCTALGDAKFSGNEPTSGSATVTPGAAGSETLTLTCLGNGQTASASQLLTITAPPPSSSGGGGLDGAWLALLGSLFAVRALWPAAVIMRPADKNNLTEVL
jgi:hypothetical protein